MTFRPLPVMTILSILSFCVLILLGNWQYERYVEKLDRAANPAPGIESQPVRISQIDTASIYAAQVYGLIDGEPIWRRYVSGQIEGTGEVAIVLWDATGGPDPIELEVGSLTVPKARTGNLFEKPPRDAPFGFEDDPESGIWYQFNSAEMADYFGIASSEPIRVFEPLAITIRNSADLSRVRTTANIYAYPKPVDPLPPERHFGYALTWWGMALGLLGVYIAYHHSLGRLRFRS